MGQERPIYQLEGGGSGLFREFPLLPPPCRWHQRRDFAEFPLCRWANESRQSQFWRQGQAQSLLAEVVLGQVAASSENFAELTNTSGQNGPARADGGVFAFHAHQFEKHALVGVFGAIDEQCGKFADIENSNVRRYSPPRRQRRVDTRAESEPGQRRWRCLQRRRLPILNRLVAPRAASSSVQIRAWLHSRPGKDEGDSGKVNRGNDQAGLSSRDNDILEKNNVILRLNGWGRPFGPLLEQVQRPQSGRPGAY